MKIQYENGGATKKIGLKSFILDAFLFFLERRGTSGLVEVPRLLEAGLEDDQTTRRVDRDVRAGGVA